MVATCRTLRIGGTPTPGFTMTSDKYTNFGPFTANLSISFPAHPGATVSIVLYNGGTTPDTCIKDVILNTSSTGTTTYNVQSTKIIYATLKVGATCCIGFDTCTSSNYVSLTVIPIGNIAFISTPEPGAEIWLAPHGQLPVDKLLATPNTISNLPAGTYDYILKKTGYNDAPGSVDILENQITTITVPMTPAEGCIYFYSTPQMAEIWIDGSAGTVVDTGFNTPKLICGLSLGSHVFKLKLAGYDDVIDTAILVAGSGLIITKTLRQSPILADITISPLNPTVTVGRTRTFSATPMDQYGDPFPSAVTWSSRNTYVGIINPDTGVFSAQNEGSTVITATSGTISKSTTTTVTIELPVLTTIAVSPTTLSIEVGNSSIFTASPKDQFGDPFSATMAWTSSNTNVGTINPSGIFTAIAQGSTIITATSGIVSGIAVANVTIGVQPPVRAGILGNLETAAFILGLSVFATVLVYKQAKIKILERT